MGIFDFLNTKKYKTQIEQLEYEKNVLNQEKLSVKQMSALELKQDILNKEKEIENISRIIDTLKNKEAEIAAKVSKQEKKLQELKKQLIFTNEAIEMESYGLYTPRYDFASSLTYKAALDELRARQKQMIKDKSAVNYFENWTVDGSKAKGKKMTNDTIKQILRSFNNECEAAINKVKSSNFESIAKRINTSFTQLNKLNETNRVSIRPQYLDLKINELILAYEYERKKAEEKEALREQREREREEKAVQKEIENKRKIINKEINHFTKMISEISEKLTTAKDDEIGALKQQLAELQRQIEEKHAEEKELDYRSANASAGYVYIISNIGSFGKDVVKIGVTRRLEPLDRIAELSSASVPFKFDVHALIFSYDAYKLEAELHQYFDAKRINKVNSRKEFFKISIPELKEKLQEYKNLTVDFQETADAEEYRESQKI